MSSIETSESATLDRTVNPADRLGLAIAALVVPVVTAIAVYFAPSLVLAVGIGVLTVVITTVLLVIDANRLGKYDATGMEREDSGLLAVGMFLLWIVFYPLAYFRRRLFGGPNLGYLAVLVALFNVGGPLLLTWLTPPSLPTCNSDTVKQALSQLIRSGPLGSVTRSIDGHRQVKYDWSASAREGECIVHTDAGDITVEFRVYWKDGRGGGSSVRLTRPHLPSCTSPHVVKTLEEIIRKSKTGTTARSIHSHRQISYDPVAEQIQAECIIETGSEEIPISYFVEWQDPDRTRPYIRVVMLDLPDCASYDITSQVEQIIRRSELGPITRSVDGYRDLGYDPIDDVRRGECVAHTEQGDARVTFSVEWLNRRQGQYQVRASVAEQ
jgi:hypothetical protein